MKRQDKSSWQLALVIVGILLSHALSTAPAQTVPQIAQKALAATVSLEMQDKSGVTLGRGSGFFVEPNLIATNYHVIEGAAQGTAKLVGKNTEYPIEGFTAIDKTNDLALLKVTVRSINPLLLGDSDTIQIGETVYVAGNPLGFEGTISDGIISGRRDKYVKERLQMTAPISPGSSGGPVLNGKGKVIGVSVAIHRRLDAQNLNFAIPSNYLKILLARSGTVKSFSQQRQSISAETYFIRGYEKSELGDYKRAIADYTQAIRLKPDYALAYYNRGTAKVELGQYFAAIVDLDTAIHLKPNYADAYVGRGIAKGKLGQYLAEISDYDTAIRLKPDYALAYYNRGSAKGKGSKHSAAIADFDTAIRLKPDYVDAYVGRGIAKTRIGDYFAAIANFDTAIRLKPNDAEAYVGRGFVRARIGDYFTAIADFDTVIRLQPENAIAYFNRGNAKAIQKRYWEAKQDLRIAWKLAERSDDEGLKARIKKTLQVIDK